MLKSNIKRTSTMMKRLFPTALAVLLLLLAGCTAKPDTSDQSKPTDYYLTDTDLPLDDAARLRAAPDFLTAEQQTLYRQAFALYSAMFDGETTGIDDAFPAAGGQTEYDEYTPDGSDYTYISCPLIISSFSCTIFSDIVCCLLSNVCVVTSFYQSLQAMSSFMHFPICATYCTLSKLSAS